MRHIINITVLVAVFVRPCVTWTYLSAIPENADAAVIAQACSGLCESTPLGFVINDCKFMW